jgi:hypothetical protein
MEAPYWQAIIHHNALKFIGFYVDSKELHPLSSGSSGLLLFEQGTL